MAVFIGNIHGIDTSTLETTIQNYTLGLSGKHPIYGVQYVNGRSDGVREYTAQNMIWEPSTASYKGKDDFADLDFHYNEIVNEDRKDMDFNVKVVSAAAQRLENKIG